MQINYITSRFLLSLHTVFPLSVKQELVVPVYIKRSNILVIRKILENTDSELTCKTVKNPGTHLPENPPSRTQGPGNKIEEM